MSGRKLTDEEAQCSAAPNDEQQQQQKINHNPHPKPDVDSHETATPHNDMPNSPDPTVTATLFKLPIWILHSKVVRSSAFLRHAFTADSQQKRVASPC